MIPKLVLAVVLILLLLCARVEWSIHNSTSSMRELTGKVVSLPKGEEGVEACLGFKGMEPVLMSGVKMSSAVDDDFFGVKFKNAAKVERITEYCQWQEKNTPERGGGESMPIQERFNYGVGWHRKLINSNLFNLSEEHHNPKRNPVKSHSYSALAFIGTGDNQVAVDSRDYPVDKPENWEIPDDIEISEKAELAGFMVRGKYFFSEYMGLGFSFNWFGKRHLCTPGDVRVSFKASYFPKTNVSIMGVRSPHKNKVEPYTSTSGDKLFLTAPGIATVNDIVEQEIGKRLQTRFVARITAGILVLVWIIGGLFGLVYCPCIAKKSAPLPDRNGEISYNSLER